MDYSEGYFWPIKWFMEKECSSFKQKWKRMICQRLSKLLPHSRVPGFLHCPNWPVKPKSVARIHRTTSLPLDQSWKDWKHTEDNRTCFNLFLFRQKSRNCLTEKMILTMSSYFPVANLLPSPAPSDISQLLFACHVSKCLFGLTVWILIVEEKNSRPKINQTQNLCWNKSEHIYCKELYILMPGKHIYLEWQNPRFSVNNDNIVVKINAKIAL